MASRLAAGCSGKPIDAGTVTGRKREPARTDTTLVPMHVGDGNYVLMPTNTSVPERWRIRVLAEDGREDWISVAKEDHDAAAIGTRWRRERKK